MAIPSRWHMHVEPVHHIPRRILQCGRVQVWLWPRDRCKSFPTDSRTPRFKSCQSLPQSASVLLPLQCFSPLHIMHVVASTWTSASNIQHSCICSELSIPSGGEFRIFSPSRTGNLTRCGHSCMLVTPAHILSRKLTSIAIIGECHLMPLLTARLTFHLQHPLLPCTLLLMQSHFCRCS